MFIAVPDILKNQVTDVSHGHWRVQAVIISSSNSRTLLINIYFLVTVEEMQVENLREQLKLLIISDYWPPGGTPWLL